MQTFTVEHQCPVSIEYVKELNQFRIVYGEEIRLTPNYADATAYLGQALMHAAQCAGEFDDY